MNKMPLVSVAIPTYNQENSILRALKSVLSQSYRYIEIIIGDDSTNTKTYQVVQEYLCDENIKYIRNKNRLGASKNYMQCLQIANGRYYLNLDGDDYLTDVDFITKAVSIFNGFNDVVMVIGGQNIVTESGDLVQVQVQTNLDCYKINGGEFLLKNVLGKTQTIPHLSTIVDLNLAKSVGYYTSNILNTDLLSVRKLMCRGDIVLIKNICGSWVLSGTNSSRTNNIKLHVENVICVIEPLYYYKHQNSSYIKSAEFDAILSQAVARYITSIQTLLTFTDGPLVNILEFNRGIKNFINNINYIDGIVLKFWSFAIIRNIFLRYVCGIRFYKIIRDNRIKMKKYLRFCSLNIIQARF